MPNWCVLNPFHGQKMKENCFSTGEWKSREPLLAKAVLEQLPRASLGYPWSCHVPRPDWNRNWTADLITYVNFCRVTSISVSCLSFCFHDLNVFPLIQFWFWSVTKFLCFVFLILKFSFTDFLSFFTYEKGLGHVSFKIKFGCSPKIK